MYNPSNPNGQTDFDIKSNWWQQVFNVQGDNSEVRCAIPGMCCQACLNAASFAQLQALLCMS